MSNPQIELLKKPDGMKWATYRRLFGRCLRKVRHHSKALAVEEAEQISAVNRVLGCEPVVAYLCDVCGWWHIGRPRSLPAPPAAPEAIR